MKEKNFKVEVITPTIMGGADSKEIDSMRIRLSEIKSMMRYAFRTVAGKYINHNNDMKKLLEVEGKIFGDTSCKSDFKMLLENTENLKINWIKLLPHKSSFSKQAILPNQTFDLTLISNSYPIEFYESLLNLAFLFGVGNRRNRLNGNLQINYNLLIAEDIKRISNVCKDLFKTDQEIKTDEPLYPTFTFRKDDQKNYLVYSMPLKKEFVEKNLNFENILKNLYEKVIHEIEKKGEFSKILGSSNPRQASFVNFSIQKTKENSYKLYLIAFYYKNRNFDYHIWKGAVDKIKEQAEKTFKGS